MREVFHGNGDKVRVFEPTKELDKDLELLVLFQNSFSPVPLQMRLFTQKVLG
jgi:hypothetical protein